MSELWKNGDYVKRYNNVYGITGEQMDRYLAPLNLAPDDRAVEFGCGNGEALARVADIAAAAVGVDISKEQLENARLKLEGRKNIILVESSFLDCRAKLGGHSFTKGLSRKALHHLTDPEKKIFVEKTAPLFKKDSIFVLEDGIFNFDRALLNEKVPEIVAEAKIYYGEAWPLIEKDFMITILEEFVADYKTWEAAFNHGGFMMTARKAYSMFYGMMVFKKIG